MSMDDTIAIIVAISPILTGVGALIGSWYASRRKAGIDELTALRNRVDELTTDNIELVKENLLLRRQISILVTAMEKAGIKVPELPEKDDA